MSWFQTKKKTFLRLFCVTKIIQNWLLVLENNSNWLQPGWKKKSEQKDKLSYGALSEKLDFLQLLNWCLQNLDINRWISAPGCRPSGQGCKEKAIFEITSIDTSKQKVCWECGWVWEKQLRKIKSGGVLDGMGQAQWGKKWWSEMLGWC